MLELKNVTITLKSGRNSDVFKLENINMTLDKEKRIILGPNGSGKTTILRAIAGIIPYEGQILVDGNDVRRIRNYLGLSTNLPDTTIGITVGDVVYLFEELKGLDRSLFLSMLKTLNFSEDILKKKMYTLSAGQSVIVRTLLALASRPKIIALDEPFENVDPARRTIIANFIKEYGEEGLFVTHEMDILNKFKDYKVYLLISGKLYGPLIVSDLLRSSIVEGESPDALETVEIFGKKFSIVLGDKGVKFGELGSLNRLYGVLEV